MSPEQRRDYEADLKMARDYRAELNGARYLGESNERAKTIEKLRAIGWTEEQIADFYK